MQLAVNTCGVTVQMPCVVTCLMLRHCVRPQTGLQARHNPRDIRIIVPLKC